MYIIYLISSASKTSIFAIMDHRSLDDRYALATDLTTASQPADEVDEAALAKHRAALQEWEHARNQQHHTMALSILQGWARMYPYFMGHPQVEPFTGSSDFQVLVNINEHYPPTGPRPSVSQLRAFMQAACPTYGQGLCSLAEAGTCISKFLRVGYTYTKQPPLPFLIFASFMDPEASTYCPNVITFPVVHLPHFPG